MAKTVGVSSSAALPTIEKQVRAAPSIGDIARRAVALFQRWQDHHIDTFIHERGGVMTDGMEREIARKFNLGG
ncbi:MAG: hypothetical protein WBX25_25770 [Rhodomicrobium sp.]